MVRRGRPYPKPSPRTRCSSCLPRSTTPWIRRSSCSYSGAPGLWSTSRGRYRLDAAGHPHRPRQRPERSAGLRLSRCDGESQACLTYRPSTCRGLQCSGTRSAPSGRCRSRRSKRRWSAMPRPRGSPRVVIASGIPLRRTYAEQGTEIVIIKEFLGHASIASSERYARYRIRRSNRSICGACRKSCTRVRCKRSPCEYYILQK